MFSTYKLFGLILLSCSQFVDSQDSELDLVDCGDARYHPTEYTCYDGDFLCPVLDGKATLRCGPDCYSSSMYGCTDGHLIQLPTKSPTSNGTCPAASFHLSDPPYENYFYSDCNSNSQVVVTSPLADSNLTIIGPRLIIAWPAGNSGICTFFQPENGINGTLGISLLNSTVGSPLGPSYNNSNDQSPYVGVESVIEFNSSAVLTLAILGSIRTIRDFTEGPSLLQSDIQDGNKFNNGSDGCVSISRLWLDNQTTTILSFIPQGNGSVTIDNQTLVFTEGQYQFSASFNYPQLNQLGPQEVLNEASFGLITENGTNTEALSFLSYSEKLLAGAWRFLTYFGRDSMISALLLEPILSQGNASATEAVIGAVLERLNSTDGSVCHEETIGDYATYLNLQENITSIAPQYDYKMVDSDYYLPILMNKYFLQSDTGKARLKTFLSTKAGTVNPNNLGLTWGDLAAISATKIMNTSAPFASEQVKENLIHLKEGQIVGEWRDSTYGIGGGRIPYDVNTALVPAALRAIGSLSRATNGSIYPGHADWSSLSDQYAQIWEDKTLAFFEVNVAQDEAISRVESFANSSTFYTGPSNADSITSNVTFYGLALDGYNNLSKVEVLNTDDCFRHFLLNTTNQEQLRAFINQTANNILRPFPAGLTTDLGMVVANPALADQGSSILQANFTNSAYHGTVVWSWQLAMMAKGLELQLDRCGTSVVQGSQPDFCNDSTIYQNLLNAYNKLWNVIDANKQYLSGEVWSWTWQGGQNGTYAYTPLGNLPPPPGVSGSTESNIRQLWSLTFLAVQRNSAFK